MSFAAEVRQRHRTHPCFHRPPKHAAICAYRTRARLGCSALFTVPVNLKSAMKRGRAMFCSVAFVNNPLLVRDIPLFLSHLQ